MEYHPGLENLDEDGYTQLDFNSRGITRKPVISEKGICSSSPCWRAIAVTLGILCLVILGIVVVLGTSVTWRSNSESNSLEKGNFTSRNKETHSPTTQESLFPTKTPTAPGIFSSPCAPNWIMREKSCYLFGTSEQSWNNSKTKCSQEGSTLLKIDSPKELEFIERQMSSQPHASFWIGLSRASAKGPWLWEDGSLFSSNLFQIRSTDTQGRSSHNCVWIHASIIYDQLCSVPSYSICEKKLST
nr:C-type lectin domain family 7 member A-like isoform X1 [Dasypus novemcinctus]